MQTLRPETRAGRSQLRNPFVFWCGYLWFSSHPRYILRGFILALEHFQPNLKSLASLVRTFGHWMGDGLLGRCFRGFRSRPENGQFHLALLEVLDDTAHRAESKSSPKPSALALTTKIELELQHRFPAIGCVAR